MCWHIGQRLAEGLPCTLLNMQVWWLCVRLTLKAAAHWPGKDASVAGLPCGLYWQQDQFALKSHPK